MSRSAAFAALLLPGLLWGCAASPPLPEAKPATAPPPNRAAVPAAKERPSPAKRSPPPASSLDAAAQKAAEHLRELAKEASADTSAPDPGDLQKRYERLLGLAGTPDERKPEILLRLAELAYRDEEAALKSLYEADAAARRGQELRYPRAVAYYRKLVDAYPSSPQALTAFYNLGYLYSEEGKQGLSAWAYAEVLRRDPSTPYADEIHMRLGEAAFDGGEMDAAVGHYRAVVARGNPEYVDKALYKLGWSFYNQSNFSAAVESFSRVLEPKPVNRENLRRETLEVMARSFAEWGGVEGVRRYLAATESAQPYGDALFQLLGDLYADSSRYENAVQAYAAGVDSYPAAPSCLAMEKKLLSALLILRDLETANTRRESWAGRYGPSSPWAKANTPGALAAERDALIEEGLRLAALYRHSQAQRGQGSTTRAVELYARYLEAFGSGSDEGYEMAFAYAQALKEEGRLEQADAQYLTVAMDPRRSSHREEASYRRIEVLQALFARDPATLDRLTAAQEKYAELNPDSPLVAQVLFAEGELYLGAERFAEARAAFFRVARDHSQDPLAPEALERLARCHFQEKDYARAEAVGREALARKPSPEAAERASKILAFSIFKQGEAAEAAGDREGANRHFLRVSEEFSGAEVAQVALFRAAENLQGLGRPAEAADAYGRVAKTYPGTPYARNALAAAAEICASLGNWPSAARYYEALYRAEPESPGAPDVLFRSAAAFETAGDPTEAARVFAEFAERYPRDARRTEALVRQGKALRTRGQDGEAAERFREAWETETGPSADPYRAEAALRRGEMALEAFGKAELKGDLEEALTRKEALLEEALARLAEAASLPFAETVTAALFQGGKAFEEMKAAILASERPADLTEEEREQYDFLLEEKALPLEEKAVDFYKKGVAAARASAVHTRWVDRMYERLEALLPWAYQRAEEPATAWVLPDLPALRPLSQEALR